MKNILLLIGLLSGFSLNLKAQFSEEEKEILKIANSQDSLPRSLFLDSTLLPGMNLKIVNTRQIWTAKSLGTKQIEMFFDIRLKFTNHDSALSFHRKYQQLNSEYGPEITDHSIKVAGMDEFRLYGGAEIFYKMIGDQGLQVFCFNFVVKNYFVKFYMMCNEDYKPKKFQHFVSEAVRRIQ